MSKLQAISDRFIVTRLGGSYDHDEFEVLDKWMDETYEVSRPLDTYASDVLDEFEE